MILYRDGKESTVVFLVERNYSRVVGKKISKKFLNLSGLIISPTVVPLSNFY